MPLRYADHRKDPAAWAAALGIPREAVDLYLASDVIDLHTTSFIWTRVFGYDLASLHRSRIPGTPFLNQVDFPRMREAALGGVVWDITTNPFRPPWSRPRTTFRNIRSLADLIKAHPDELALVRTEADYRAARMAGKTACWLSLQGGQALDWDLADLSRTPEKLHRITLVHFTRSRIGTSSAAGEPEAMLTGFGRDFVREMNRLRIIVDLSHINRRGFFDALKVHDPSLPPIVSHTGVRGVRDLWRNLDDGQIRAVADRGGTIGIIYNPAFLDSGWTDCPLSRVVDHMEHVIRVAGEDFVSLGSDYDGMILLPREMHDITGLPKLAALMLERNWTETRIQKILGGNYLRVVRAVCG